MSAGRPWMTSELTILRQHYVAGGLAAALPLLPNRSPDAVTSAAWKHGISRLSQRAWSEGEDAELRRLYPTGGPDACAGALPGRTRDAIIGRAHQLRVRSGAPRGWAARKLLSENRQLLSSERSA